MDFTFYKNFLTIAETGNLTTAAKKLSLAQPALSAQLKQLEAYYGVKLVETCRGKRSLTLTEAGTSFLLKAQQICRAEEQMLMDMQSFHSTAQGNLHISVSPAAVNSFMENYLLPFAEKNPEISYVLLEESVQEQINNIHKGNSDLAYANAPLPEMKDFYCHQLQRESFFAVFKEAFPFSAKDSLTLKDIQNYELSCNQGCYGLLRQLCEQNGFTPKLKFLSITGPTAAYFANSGQSIAIVPDDCSKQLPSGLRRLPIQEEAFSFTKTIFWSKDRILPAPAQKFLSFITNQQRK